MRCDAARQVLEEGLERPPAVQVHVNSCSDCKEYLRHWEMLHSGLVALQEEIPPEPTIGFTTRLMRRLENAPVDLRFGQQFVDQIGRRVVYASLMVALMLMMLLMLPSSGPYRSPGISESVLVRAQVAALSNEQVLGVDGVDNGDPADVATPSASSGTGARGSK